MSNFWKPGSSEHAPKNQEKTNQLQKGGKTVLSSNVLSMKFMKRKDEKDEVAEEEARKRRRVLHLDDSSSKDEPFHASSTGGKLVVTVESISLYSALPGRRSFRGANKVVERQYAATLESHRIDKKYGNLSASTEEVDDEELLRRYASIRKGRQKRKKE